MEATRAARGQREPGEQPAGTAPGPDTREYRAEELAQAAGITPRTLRFYRERRLLPPPRRAGRVAWFNEQHLERLRTIAALLARGHTLGGIAEILTALASGRDSGTARLLGVHEPQPWAEEEQVRLSARELADHYAGETDPENVALAMEIGYLRPDGEAVVHVSRDLLEASSALVREGIPLAILLAAGRELRAHADALAEVFTEVLRRQVLPEVLGEGRAERGAPASETDIARLTEALERLRPLAKKAVYAEVSLALDRRLRAELDPPPPPPA
ncbi:MerR family transcriptional regulator [Streptomyces sp. DSM 44915]|uniref:MerR family transcriptional regulator n=1 Tax=Streptomyces chisholmiae TaxID=3075540 RepID=A0ABU2JTI6_9ACTN|nr:MerR family transcriptional regulator [Streptomyces sp. DSM 44915]MDT0268302.1 MerR family transcriptional regulator [Streptomyces sp. DSM 44915]